MRAQGGREGERWREREEREREREIERACDVSGRMAGCEWARGGA